MPRKPPSPTQNPAEKAWFRASKMDGLPRLREIFAEGVDINCVDEHGRTALFYAMAPFGGDEAMVKWLVKNGADVNVRDATGETALDFGAGAVTSALENNMIAHAGDLFRRHGYRGSHRDRTSWTRSAKPTRRKLSDFWGAWTISDGVAQGTRIRISSTRIDSEVGWLDLYVEECSLDEEGHLILHGDHATELVHVTVRIKSPGVALLRWSDGIMGPLPEIKLIR